MIDEKKLIAEIREKIRPESFGEQCNSLDVIYAMLQLIDEQPKVGEWIPCSERLPETDDVVLITVFNIDNNKLFVTPAVYQHPFFCTWNTLAPEDKVIAWQPLPEPWEGEGDV